MKKGTLALSASNMFGFLNEIESINMMSGTIMHIDKKETPEDTFYSFFFMCISII